MGRLEGLSYLAPGSGAEAAGQICSGPSCDQRLSLCPAAILSELLQRENRVLHFWTLKKRRLDQCQQYVVFERSAKQVCSELSLALPPFWGPYRGLDDQDLGQSSRGS